MTDEQIKKQIEVIRALTADLLSQGADACRKFLQDAGIILVDGKIKYECLLCGRKNFDKPSPHRCTPKGTVRKRGLKYRKYILPHPPKDRV